MQQNWHTACYRGHQPDCYTATGHFLHSLQQTALSEGQRSCLLGNVTFSIDEKTIVKGLDNKLLLLKTFLKTSFIFIHVCMCPLYSISTM